jgi:hypothetical protein
MYATGLFSTHIVQAPGQNPGVLCCPGSDTFTTYGVSDEIQNA